MRIWRPHWANWKFWLKVLGLSFLLASFWTQPFGIDLVWIGVYLAIALGVGLLFAFVANPIIERVIPNQNINVSPHGDRRLGEAKRRPWLEALLLPGEDGFFFVPLLLVGITPITATVTAVAYAAIHYPEFPVKHCFSKAVAVFLIATLVLPHGLGSVVIGHLILDALTYQLWSQRTSRSVVSGNDGH